jgi:cation diffusion facilitator CzcD-associated flavoprotein CzcO
MPADKPLRIAIIGAGMSGILAAIKLRESGYDDVVLYEKAERLGGTWRENTYPGIGCDVPSHLYSYTFEPNPDWSHHYSPGEEIQGYFEAVARKHGIDRRIRFAEEVTRCEWRDGRWQIDTSRGRRDVADAVIAATGVLHHPNVPELPGMDSFAGACFHSARWDHSVPLDGRRVGVIGTGSTAVQITSALVPRVARFSLFQRTAQWVMAQENPAYTAAEQAAFRADPASLVTTRQVMSGLFLDTFANSVIDASSPGMKMIEENCLRNLETVTDLELREKLRPDYRAACKRLVISPDFYEKIQRFNAELVTSPIERIEPEGVRTKDGAMHGLDVLVLATGFRPDRFIRPTTVIGQDGRDLDAFWQRHPTAYLSVAIPGFPNFFMLNGPNGPVGNFSLILVAEHQTAYILQLIDLLRDGRASAVAPRGDVTAAFDAERVAAAKSSIWSTGCRSWYLDDRGIPMSWPWTFARFAEEMSRPKLEAFELC